MKNQITRKQIYNIYGKHFTVCLGDRFSNFFNRFGDPVYYTCGVYGWNSDIFCFGNFCVSVGYRPFGNNDVKIQNIIEKNIHSNDKDIFAQVINQIRDILKNK